MLSVPGRCQKNESDRIRAGAPFYGEYLLLFIYFYAYARFKFNREVIRKHGDAFNEFMD